MSTLRRRERPPVPPQEIQEIPLGVRRLAAWSWRLIIIGIAATIIIWGILQIPTLVIAVLVAVLLTALLAPLVRMLTTYTFLGKMASSAIALIGLLVLIAGMFTLAGRQLIAQFASISQTAVEGFGQVTDWLSTTFELNIADLVNNAVEEVRSQLSEYSQTIIDSAVSTLGIVGNIVTGVIIVLFTLFFLLANGTTIWRWCIGLLPPEARIPTHEACRRGWKSLSAYVRTQILVAAVDATGIALGMVFLGLPAYGVPIWLIVFLFSFVPLLGAILSGAIAILLMLVMQGWVYALLMLGVVLLVQQAESNLLQPLLMGKAVAIHPLAVFLGVVLGTTVAGVAGALFVIPVMAFANSTMLYLTGRDPSPELGTDPGMVEAMQERRRSRTA